MQLINKNNNDRSASSVECFVNEISIHQISSNLNVDIDEFKDYLLNLSKNKSISNDSTSLSSISSSNSLANLYLVNKVDNNTTTTSSTLSTSSLRYSICIGIDSITWKVYPDDLDIKSDQLDNNNNLPLQLYTSFQDIKLCYVNFELSNYITWLLSSIPQRIYSDRIDKTLSGCNDRKFDGTIAVVCQFNCEKDVVKLRNVYRQLRSIKKFSSDFNQYENMINKMQSITFPTMKLNKNGNIKNVTSSTAAIINTNVSESRSRKQIISSQIIPKGQTKIIQNNILTRQRQPAKFIYDLSSEPIDTNAFKQHYLYRTKIKGDMLQKYSESEFDPTLIGNYLNQHRCDSIKNRSRTRFRSKSVESPRRVHLKPISTNEDEVNCNSSHRTFNKKNLIEAMIETNRIDFKQNNDNFNSEGSSLSDDSSNGEASLEKMEQTKSSPIVVKSVLKKARTPLDGEHCENRTTTSSSAIYSSFFLNNPFFNLERSKHKSKKATESRFLTLKKNVTFSAYATIQVMDN